MLLSGEERRNPLTGTDLPLQAQSKPPRVSVCADTVTECVCVCVCNNQILPLEMFWIVSIRWLRIIRCNALVFWQNSIVHFLHAVLYWIKSLRGLKVESWHCRFTFDKWEFSEGINGVWSCHPFCVKHSSKLPRTFDFWVRYQSLSSSDHHLSFCTCLFALVWIFSWNWSSSFWMEISMNTYFLLNAIACWKANWEVLLGQIKKEGFSCNKRMFYCRKARILK